MRAIDLSRVELEAASGASWCGFTLDLSRAPLIEVDLRDVSAQSVAVATWRNDLRGPKSDNLAAMVLAARSRNIRLLFVDQVSLVQDPAPSSDAIRDFTNLYRRIPAVCCYEPPAGEAVDHHASLHFFRPWIYRETTEILKSEHTPIHIGGPRKELSHRNYVQNVRHLVGSGPVQSFAHLLFGDFFIKKPGDIRYAADFTNQFLGRFLNELDEKDGQFFGFLTHVLPKRKLVIRSPFYFRPSLLDIPFTRFKFTEAEPAVSTNENGETVSMPVHDFHFDGKHIGSYMYHRGFDLHQLSPFSYHSFVFEEAIQETLFKNIDTAEPTADPALTFFDAHRNYLGAMEKAFETIENGRLMGVVQHNGEVVWRTQSDIDEGDEVYFV
jgi:hypothetical protein